MLGNCEAHPYAAVKKERNKNFPANMVGQK